MSMTSTLNGPTERKRAAGAERLSRFRPEGRRRAGAGYSRFVSAMKVLLPLGAAVLVGLVILWPLLNRPEPTEPIPVAEVPQQAADAQAQILNPRFVGMDDAGRPFTVAGTVAYQSTSQDTALEIADPVAETTLEGGIAASVRAQWAQYDRARNTVALSGAVTLSREDGFVFEAERLDFDLIRHRAWSDQPVSALGPGARIDAAGIVVRGGGDSVLFFGPARLTADRAGSGGLTLPMP